MSGVIESPASLARRRLHKIEDDTDGDGQLEAANGTTSKTEQQQPDEGSIIENKEAAIDQSTPTDDEPRNALAWLAPVFHLTMTVFYTLLLYYGITLLQGDNVKLIDPKGKIPAYGGRFKFLTHINQWVQLFVFAFLFITDMIPRSSFKKIMTKLSDIAFTAVAFPLSWFIVITFWAIYAYDRQLVYPISFDKVVPSWLNHFWHTTIGVFVLFEVMLVYHRYPKSGMAACLSLIVNAAYLSWIGWVYGQTKFWAYPIMAVLPIPFLVLFIAGCMLFSFCLFFFGRHVSTLRWGPTSAY